MRHTRRPPGRRVIILAVLACVACEGEPTEVSKGPQTAIVHAVLNPTMGNQYILLENSLSGRVDVPEIDNPDPAEPIRDRGGDPILDAYVVVYSESGDSAIALERRTDTGSPYHTGGGGKGAGVYVFFSSPPPRAPVGSPPPGPHYLSVVRGGRYRLYVRAADGRSLTAVTTVPDANASTSVPTRLFNRDRDTLRLELPPARFAKRYGIRIATPRGPMELFTDRLTYEVRGDLRNVDAKGRPLAFMPGFEQVVSLSAVDTNYFDFFRSANDSTTGLGLIEHVTGGSGVFGSYAPLSRIVVRVIADVDEPVEARYVENGTGKSLRLYVNASGAGLSELTGSYGFVGGSTSGVLGQLRGRDISLVFLAGQTLADTSFTVTGTWARDSIAGTRSGGAATVFRRAPDP